MLFYRNMMGKHELQLKLMILPHDFGCCAIMRFRKLGAKPRLWMFSTITRQSHDLSAITRLQMSRTRPTVLPGTGLGRDTKVYFQHIPIGRATSVYAVSKVLFLTIIVKTNYKLLRRNLFMLGRNKRVSNDVKHIMHWTVRI